MSEQRCEATTKKGTRCSNMAAGSHEGRWLCHLHHPQMTFRQQQSQRRQVGVRQRSRRARDHGEALGFEAPAEASGSSIDDWSHFPDGADPIRYARWEDEPAPPGCPFVPGRYLLADPSDTPDMPGPARARRAAAVDLDSDEVPFGKHRGRHWSDVPGSYLEWMIEVDHSHAVRARRELERRESE